jgi:hypothetical protein
MRMAPPRPILPGSTKYVVHLDINVDRRTDG